MAAASVEEAVAAPFPLLDGLMSPEGLARVRGLQASGLPGGDVFVCSYPKSGAQQQCTRGVDAF